MRPIKPAKPKAPMETGAREAPLALEAAGEAALPLPVDWGDEDPPVEVPEPAVAAGAPALDPPAGEDAPVEAPVEAGAGAPAGAVAFTQLELVPAWIVTGAEKTWAPLLSLRDKVIELPVATLTFQVNEVAFVGGNCSIAGEVSGLVPGRIERK